MPKENLGRGRRRSSEKGSQSRRRRFSFHKYFTTFFYLFFFLITLLYHFFAILFFTLDIYPHPRSTTFSYSQRFVFMTFECFYFFISFFRSLLFRKSICLSELDWWISSLTEKNIEFFFNKSLFCSNECWLLTHRRTKAKVNTESN